MEEKQEITDYDHLVYRVLNTPDGQLLIEQWKDQLMEARFYPGEETSLGVYREGGQQMLRYMLSCYNNVKNYS